ncbi:MAG TPA: sensor domain-containing phosphodiesterase [Pseudomonadales bacterium]|nr:sensor domain-containing phosphodiesterase [Pseudomonadales bacterium]
MKTRSKLTLATVALSLLVLSLLVLLANSQDKISRDATDLVDRQVRLLEEVNTLYDLINRELIATNRLMADVDLALFMTQHTMVHENLEASLNRLNQLGIDAKMLDGIERHTIEYHRAIDQAVTTILQSGQDAKQQVALISHVDTLQHISYELEALILLLRQSITADIDQTRQTISNESQQMFLDAIFLGVCMMAILLVLYLNLAALRKSHKQQRALSYFPQRAPEGMLTINEQGKVLYANPRAHKLIAEFGFSRHDLEKLLPSSIEASIADLKSGATDTATWNHRVNGTTFDTTLQWLRDVNQGHVYLHDVSRTEALQKRLNYLAYFDPLTKLPNRRRFEEEIDNIISLNKYGEPQRWAVGLIRLDRFAHVTTGHGYNVGDMLLAACSQRLSDALHDYHDAHLFRFDGARFGILALASQGTGIAKALNKSMENPLIVDDVSFYLTLSMGYTITPGEDDSVAKLITNAGAALETASERGGNDVIEFTNEMRTRELKWLNMEIALRQSLFAGELDVFYQPQINSIDGSLVGMEALVRWRQANGEFIPPSEFIPLAERIGLIVVLGEWVLHKAFAQAAHWQKVFGKGCTMAVNISTKQFNHVHFLDMLRNALDTTGVDPNIIEIEITESVMLDNHDYAMQIISVMKDMGFSISIDDFGTGYSSMSYLKDLPVDKIKIDRAFVMGISLEDNDNQLRDKAIVASIVELGHNLNMKVIAEGVDNSEQVDFLRKVGCDYFQGFLFSQPIPADQMEDYINEQLSLASTSR